LNELPARPFSGWQLAAVKSALGSLESLCQPAAAAKAAAPHPSNTWPQYAKALQRLVTGEVPDTWQAATTAAAIELLTGKPQAGSAAGVLSADAAAHTRDAAWARAVAAAGATPADAHGDDDAAARHVVLGQLRLQLLLVEQQLVAATGESPYLAADAAAFGEDEDGEHAGEGVEESSEGEAGHPAAGDDDDRDGMEVDGEEEKESPAGGKGAAAKRGRPGKGVKRAASSNSVQAGSEEGDAPHEDEPASKRRKGAAAAGGKDAPAAAAGGSGGGRKAAAAAAAGLPPRPVSRNKGRVSGAGQADASRAPSRQNSLAPAHSGALPAAAAAATGGGNRGQKRGRTASLEVCRSPLSVGLLFKRIETATRLSYSTCYSCLT
jgi:hypothetical protein